MPVSDSPAKHAFLAPSSAHIWGPGGCPAHPRMAALYPQSEETEEALEGTTAHWAITGTLAGTAINVGDICPETGMPATEEMFENGAEFLIDASQILGTCRTFIEHHVRMPAIDPNNNWGRLDFGFINRKTKCIGVYDLKFGFRPVKDWWQLIDYAVGLLHEDNVVFEPGWYVELRYYQPRDFLTGQKVKTRRFSYGEFTACIKQLYDAATDACDPDAYEKTGSYCTDCSACAYCPAAQEVGAAAMDLSRRDVPNDLSGEALGMMLDRLTRAEEQIKALKRNLSAKATGDIKTGARVPGWKLSPKNGREVWTLPVEEVCALGDACGHDLRNLKTLTPKQAIKEGMDADLVRTVSETPVKGVQLIQDDGSEAQKVFGND